MTVLDADDPVSQLHKVIYNFVILRVDISYQLFVFKVKLECHFQSGIKEFAKFLPGMSYPDGFLLHCHVQFLQGVSKNCSTFD